MDGQIREKTRIVLRLNLKRLGRNRVYGIQIQTESEDTDEKVFGSDQTKIFDDVTDDIQSGIGLGIQPGL